MSSVVEKPKQPQQQPKKARIQKLLFLAPNIYIMTIEEDDDIYI